MTDPITFSAVAGGVLLGSGSGLKAISSITGGKKAKRRRKRQANEVLRAAQARADTEVRRRRRLVGDQLAAAGASGAGAGGVSAFMAILETVTESALQEEEILKGAAVEAKELKKLGKEEAKAGLIGGAGTLLTGAGEMFLMGG